MRIGIIGGGISGLTAAYECEKLGLDWRLYEASSHLGGTIATVRRDGFVLEGGPDGWVTEKPWARELAHELGLEDELISSNDSTRKTYILIDGKLQAIPDHMRMMVPLDLKALEGSPLFSEEARAVYAAELDRAEELRASAPREDESVASFVLRHFGDEVLTTLAAPLLSGVFGGDVHQLSVRAVMPQFVAMEREYGSLIAGLQAKAGSRSPKPIFTSLRGGVGTLIDALLARLPVERIHCNTSVDKIAQANDGWLLHTVAGSIAFDCILLATPLGGTHKLLQAIDATAVELLPSDASSAIIAALAWPAETAETFTIPQGFGLLMPSTSAPVGRPTLMAATFMDQKFPHRVPAGARILRAFFGGASAEALFPRTDEEIATESLAQLRAILGPIPEPAPSLTVVRRLPRSLPQYEVGHLERIAELEQRIACIKGLHLLGNAYRGVGLPDLIREARATVRSLQQG